MVQPQATIMEINKLFDSQLDREQMSQYALQSMQLHSNIINHLIYPIRNEILLTGRVVSNNYLEAKN